MIDNFLFPVPVMQELFRAKFMDFFRKAMAEQTVNPLFIATQETPNVESLIKNFYTKKWVVTTDIGFVQRLQNNEKICSSYARGVLK